MTALDRRSVDKSEKGILVMTPRTATTRLKRSRGCWSARPGCRVLSNSKQGAVGTAPFSFSAS